MSDRLNENLETGQACLPDFCTTSTTLGIDCSACSIAIAVSCEALCMDFRGSLPVLRTLDIATRVERDDYGQ